MRHIASFATDDLVSLCVCHAVVLCKTAGIEVIFGMETLGDPRHILLDRGNDLLYSDGG